MYGSILGALGAPPAGGASADAGPPNPAAMGVNAGDPPSFEGALPKPTGIGQIPTGTPGTTKIAAASAAADALREAAGYFPNLQAQINSLIDAFKAGSAPMPAGKPGGPAAPGEPAPLGTPPPSPSPVDQSGSPGAI